MNKPIHISKAIYPKDKPINNDELENHIILVLGRYVKDVKLTEDLDTEVTLTNTVKITIEVY